MENKLNTYSHPNPLNFSPYFPAVSLSSDIIISRQMSQSGRLNLTLSDSPGLALSCLKRSPFLYAEVQFHEFWYLPVLLYFLFLLLLRSNPLDHAKSRDNSFSLWWLLRDNPSSQNFQPWSMPAVVSTICTLPQWWNLLVSLLLSPLPPPFSLLLIHQCHHQEDKADSLHPQTWIGG